MPKNTLKYLDNVTTLYKIFTFLIMRYNDVIYYRNTPLKVNNLEIT